MRAALIGAGEESLHTIEKAQELGVFVTALDGNPAAAGLAAADEGLAVDISDEEAVLDALRDRKPDFVLTGPIGRYLTTAGAVNDALGLSGISRQAAELCTDKWLFHQRLAERGLRPCRCELAADCGGKEEAEARAAVDSLLKKTEDFTYPAILKPRYGSGSRGIFFLKDQEEAREALESLYGIGNEKTADCGEDYVLEEAVAGEEFGVDGAMEGDCFRMILLRRKLLTPPPARQAVGYLTVGKGEGLWEAFPAQGERPGAAETVESAKGEKESSQALELSARAEAYVGEVTRALGLMDCLLHADLMITQEQVFVIELSARPSGHNLHNLFTPMATGVDMAEAFIRSRCGLSCSHGSCGLYKPQEIRPMLIRYFDLPEGIVVSVPGREALQLPAGVTLRAWDCRIRPGDRIVPVTTGRSLMGRGYFILEGQTDRLLVETAERIEAQFVVK